MPKATQLVKAEQWLEASLFYLSMSYIANSQRAEVGVCYMLFITIGGLPMKIELEIDFENPLICQSSLHCASKLVDSMSGWCVMVRQ